MSLNNIKAPDRFRSLKIQRPSSEGNDKTVTEKQAALSHLSEEGR